MADEQPTENPSEGKRTRRRAVFVDCFSVGLDELPRRDQANSDVVLSVLRRAGRFSAFEASANSVIARTMTYLLQSGRVTVDKTTPYPWTRVVAIDGEPVERANA